MKNIETESPMDPLALASSLPPTAPADATLAEVFGAAAVDGAASGFVLAHLAPGDRVLWIQDRQTRRDAGRPFAAGIATFLGGLPDLLLLEVSRATEVLWAMEQALGCEELRAVVGEVWGEPARLDFTATKRLALRAERSGVAAWLLRRGASPDLSAARERWRISSLPSPPLPDDIHAPGEALWQGSLLRSRRRAPGEWVARRDLEARGLDLRSRPERRVARQLGDEGAPAGPASVRQKEPAHQRLGRRR